MIDALTLDISSYSTSMAFVERQSSYNQYKELRFFELYNKIYTYSASNFDIIQNVLPAFQNNTYAYTRLKDIFQDDDIKNDHIHLNQLSFYSLLSWINNRTVDFDYSIGVSDDGCAIIQHNSDSEYIYIKFYKDVDVFYNIYAKSGMLFDIITTATLSDFYKDYQRLCSAKG